ncbi:hypothetical protein FQZ97_702390 [compost metagenome]
MLARGQDHAAYARIERQLGQLPPGRRELVGVVDRAQLLQQLVAIGDGAAQRRLDERERLDIGQAQRLHAQDHRRQRRAQDFRIGEARAAGEIRLFVQPDADTIGHAAAAAGALVGGGLRDRLDLQLLDLVAVRVALDARHPGIDHVADTRHRQRSLGNVGRQHDAARVGRLEHPLLLLHRQPREQRQDLGMRRMVLAQRLGGLADLALARQEHQHVARADAAQLIDGIDDAVVQVALARLRAARRGARRRVVGDRAIAHFHRVQPPADLDHRRGLAVEREMRGKALRIDGGRGDDHLQVGPLRQDLAQVADQEVDVQAAIDRQILGSCVVLPEPVSPDTITTWLASSAAAISSRRAETGRASGNVIGGSGLTARGGRGGRSWRGPRGGRWPGSPAGRATAGSGRPAGSRAGRRAVPGICPLGSRDGLDGVDWPAPSGACGAAG